MTLYAIVGLYIALNMLLAPILMFRVGRVRVGKKINLGDGGDDLILSRIRAPMVILSKMRPSPC